MPASAWCETMRAVAGAGAGAGAGSVVACGLCASNGEARRLIQQGGVTINDKKVESIDAAYDHADFAGDGVIIKKGKKVYHKAVVQ